MRTRVALFTTMLLVLLSGMTLAQEKEHAKAGTPNRQTSKQTQKAQPRTEYQKPEKLVIRRDELKRGDRVVELDNGQVILQRASLGEWWCDCTEWEWDCDIGPGGEVWCRRVCVRMDCKKFPVVALPRD